MTNTETPNCPAGGGWDHSLGCSPKTCDRMAAEIATYIGRTVEEVKA